MAFVPKDIIYYNSSWTVLEGRWCMQCGLHAIRKWREQKVT